MHTWPALSGTRSHLGEGESHKISGLNLKVPFKEAIGMIFAFLYWFLAR